MSFYSDLQSTADRILKQYGKASTLTIKTPAAYDPTTGIAAVTSTDYAVSIAAFDYPEMDLTNTNIVRGDKKAYISAKGLTVVPFNNNTITWRGLVHTIINCKPLSPGGVDVIYICQIREGA